jgi:hypothetical protein
MTDNKKTFCVYVNHPEPRAKAHFMSCIFFEQKKAKATEQGFWEFPFLAPDKALEYVRRAGKRTWGWCKSCNYTFKEWREWAEENEGTEAIADLRRWLEAHKTQGADYLPFEYFKD